MLAFLLTLHSTTILTIIFLLIHLPIFQTYHWDGMIMYDLEYSGTTFDTEAASWTATSLVTSGVITYSCSGTKILGGYNILSCCEGNYFQRIYTDLPTHNVLYFSFTMYPLDSWDGTSGDHVNLYLDGTTVVLWYLQLYDTSYTDTNVCGSSSYNDVKPIQVYTTVPHTSTTFTFRMISQLDQVTTDESFGLRDVLMTLEVATSPATSVSYCGISVDYPLDSNVCGCEDDEYMYPANTGNCYACDSTCATCSGSGASACTSCDTGRYLVGSTCIICDGNCATCSGSPTTCTSCYSGMYLSGSTCYTCNSNCLTCVTTAMTCTSCNSGWYMVGTTCYSTCNSPLYSYVSGVVTYCATPCPGSYVMWDGSCSSSCTYSSSCGSTFTTTTYTEDTFLECKFPCSEGQFLYWNGSCLSTCPSPLTSITYLGENLCCYSCSSTQYLYWNGSCLSTCPSPLTSEIQGTSSQRNFCWYTCQPDQYLYWNGSCLSTCPSPLSGELEGAYLQRYFCWYTCQPNEYLYWNGSCLSTCPSPLSGELEGTYLQRYFCWYTCQPDEYLLWNGTCSSTCPYPLSGETQGTYLERNFCWYICMPWQWLYWDQTCQDSCDDPLWPETQGSYLERQFCWYPCASESKFLYWNGTCSFECPEPLETRYQNGQWFCDYPCSDTEYLYWNGSCISICESPLASRSEGYPTRNFCYYLCDTDEYLYWDGTCQASCDPPLTVIAEGDPVRQFCWYLCETSEYLYWNGTCSSECESPLTQRTTNDRKFCDYKCSSDQYLYWNGSCLSTCPSPLISETQGESDSEQASFCWYPCQTEEYLYWNGSCLSTCDSPLSTRIEGSSIQRKFCDYLCVGNQYLYWNGTCKTTCNLPFVVRIDIDKRFCDYLCSASEFMYWDGSCNISCSSPLVSYSQGTPSRSYCKYPCSATQFLYWNGTCSDSCDSPLTSYVSKGRLFCQYSCQTDQYLYINGSCLDSCPSTLVTRVEDDLNYCDYPCDDSEYLYWNGTCSESCYSPLVAITTDSLNSCEFPCESTTDFLYWNGTCSSECDSPFTQITQGNRKFCSTACADNYYLYWNSSCLSSCDSPLFTTSLDDTTTVQICSYPCTDDSQYLYWNGSCLSECDSPLSSRTTAGLNYCDYPCESSSYLYWNGSCLSTCDSALESQTESSKLYCDFPCSTTTNYLNWDGSCSSSCDSPLVTKTDGSVKFCLITCDTDDYVYWNGSCLSTCPSPFIQESDSTYKYCNSPCSDSDGQYYYEELEACYDECNLPAYIDNKEDYLRCLTFETSTTGSSFSDMFLYAPLEAGTVTIVKLVKVMQYVKYLDINMPPRLERLGISKGRNILSFSSGIQMSADLQNEYFPKQSLSYVYLKNDLHSSFLVNYWEDLCNILIAIIAAFLLFVLEKIFRAFDWSVPEVVCQVLRVIAKWNFVLMVFAINIDDIILFAALEFKSLPESNSLSVGLSVLFLCAIIVLTSVTALSIIRMRKKKLTRPTEDCQVLFNGFKTNDLLCQLFFIIYMLRIGIPMLIAVCLEITPLGNTILQVILSSLVLAFLLIKKPFIKKINHYQLAIFESIVLLMNFSMLLLTILSMMNKQNTTFAIILGDIVIVGNDIINVMCLGFLVIKLHIESKAILAFLKKHQVTKSEALGLWLQLLFVPLQFAHMGFEEMIAYNMTSQDPNKREATFRKGKLNKPKPVYELQNEFDHTSFEQSRIDVPEASTDRNHLLRNRSKLFEIDPNKTELIEEAIETFGDTPQFSTRIISPPSQKSPSQKFFHQTSLDENSSDFIIGGGSGPTSPNSDTLSIQRTRSNEQNNKSIRGILKSPRSEFFKASPKNNQTNLASLKSGGLLSAMQGTKGILKKSSSLSDQNQSLFLFKNKSQENNIAPFANILDIASVNSFDDVLNNFTHNPSIIQNKRPVYARGNTNSDLSFLSNHSKSGERASSSNSASEDNGLALHFTISNGSNNSTKKSPFYKERNVSFERNNQLMEEKPQGWTRVKRHFNFEGVSGEGHLRDGAVVDKKTRLRGKLPLSLWSEGEKLFTLQNDKKE